MKKIRMAIMLIPVILMLAGNGAFAALKTTVDFGDDATYGDIETAVENSLDSELAKYTDMPDLSRGFGNANTYASNGGTMRGYQGYDLISVAVGTMVSVQAPNSDPMFFTKIQDDLNDGDVYAGIGVNPVVANVGINLGFIVPDLYISFKFGKLDYDIDQGDFSLDYDSNLFGILLNYQILKDRSILAGAILWRGLSAGTGFIYSTNNVTYLKKLDTIENIDSGSGIIAKVDPSVDFSIDIKSYIVPVEIYSAIRLLWAINLGVGVGFDYVVGSKAELSVLGAGKAEITSSPMNALDGDTGDISIDASTSNEADPFRTKFMANIGFGFGPVVVDVPLTYYLDNGYSLGISVGFNW